MQKRYLIQDVSDSMYYAGGPNWVEDKKDAATFVGPSNGADMIQTIRNTFDELGELALVATEERVEA